MQRRPRGLDLCVALAFAACNAPKSALPVHPTPAAPVATSDRDVPMPLDPSVHTGKLANGVSYLIQVMPSMPAANASIGLAINVGSLDETEDERGAAHLLLHLMGPIAGAGAETPDDLGFVTFDHTVVSLAGVNASDAGTIDRALMTLRQCADGVEIDQRRVDAAVREVAVADRAYLHVEGTPREWLGTSRVTHPPFGDPDLAVPPTVVGTLAFYERWYRPDHMAVIVAGNVDAAAIARAIELRFGTLRTTNARAPIHPSVTARRHDELAVDVGVAERGDPATLEVSQRIPRRKLRNERGYRAWLVDAFIQDVLVKRWHAIDPSGHADSSIVALDATRDLSRFEVWVDDVDEVRKFLAEIERLRSQGVTQAELDDAKREYAAHADDPGASGWNQGDWVVGSLARYFRDGSPHESLAVNRASARLFATVTLAEVNAVACATFVERGRTLGLDATPATPLTPDMLRAMR